MALAQVRHDDVTTTSRRAAASAPGLPLGHVVEQLLPRLVHRGVAAHVYGLQGAVGLMGCGGKGGGKQDGDEVLSKNSLRDSPVVLLLLGKGARWSLLCRALWPSWNSCKWGQERRDD
jgi:hypothetical protein